MEVPIPAAGMVSAVGSLASARVRMAGAGETRALAGPLEILALNGTVGAGGAHLHMMVSNPEGACFGGHVCGGCIVHTTVELVLLELRDLRFEREHDPRTGYSELAIQQLRDPRPSDASGSK